MPPIRTTTNTNGDTHRQRPLSLAPTAPKRSVDDWQEVRLKGEDEGSIPIYDDCDDIRRKIRKLQRSQGFRITYWLRNIGGVKYNSWSRFMKAEGPSAGAENNIYYAAYVYFEKVRIAEGKKKPTKREQNELAYPQGFVMLDRRQTRDSTHH